MDKLHADSQQYAVRRQPTGIKTLVRTQWQAETFLHVYDYVETITLYFTYVTLTAVRI